MSNKKEKKGFKLRLLDKYVGREFLISYAIALSVILSLRILIDLLVMYDEFVETQKGLADPTAFEVLANIAAYYGPKIFEYFRDFSGIIILIAAIFSLARMARQNELVAILASGISLKRVLAPIILLGIALNMLMVLDQECIIPKLADRLVLKHDEMRNIQTVDISSLPDRNNSLFSGTYDPKDGSISDLYIILRHEKQMYALIKASRATWNPKQESWELTDGRKIFYTGFDHETNCQFEHKSDIVTTKFDSYKSDLPPEYLMLQRNSAFKNVMSSLELSQLLKRNLKPVERAEILSEKHFRFTDPLINMTILLLGLPLLISRERKNTKSSIAMVLLGAGGCFIVAFACKLLAGGNLYADQEFKRLLLAWLPVIIFMPLSILSLDSIKT
ncbi:MAG: LptF/LptG family permease [Phycisphaerae bacterium]|nr:LptF/LptG family permease [Phycisphaerae bacterium]